jgi:formate hydrogenlyase transcriptional activator
VSNLDLIELACVQRKFEQIIGNSPALESALTEVERVAPTNATVLVLGETGTGKELIAHAIHNLSPRRDRPFVKLDCAAIPFDLLESELFGHEKGAFSWALAQRIGRFEMADSGTLFLDEIGDLPVELQPKLLRILQEQEFERPGSSRTHRVNVRLVAATHRDLTGMISQGEFRSDLYYRLNGFPIMLPPLRERCEDIPLLVSHFVEKFSTCVGKRIHDIPEDTLRAFMKHSWPGNVRELQNLVERGVILANDGVLPNPLSVSNPILTTGASAESVFNGFRKGAPRSNNGLAAPPLSLNGEDSPAAPRQVTFNGSKRGTERSNCRATSDPIARLVEHSPQPANMHGYELRAPVASPDLPIVFVVDDDASVRGSMERLIRHAGWHPITFAFAHEFLSRPRPIEPNCLVIDFSLQDVNSLDLQKQFAIERTETPIIFIAGNGDVPTSVQAMKAGAVEFLIKPFSDEALLGAVKEALKRSSNALGREAEMRAVRDSYATLSHRERQVMALVLSGLLNKQVGAELGISEITVKAHRGRVMQKMGAKSVVDLVKMATKLRSERTIAGPVQFRAASSSASIPSSPSVR